MKACRIVEHGTPGRFEMVELPELRPGPDEVVVAVKACGLNRLDLWVEEGGLPVKVGLPRICGGEIAGTILRLGGDVDDWRIGERVAVQSNLFCGECEFCLRGEVSICLKGQLLGVDCDGGFAEEVRVPARSLVRIPEGVSFSASAALTLAGSTAMHMLTDRGSVQPGDWVLVNGAAGGVGVYAVQIARELGARVIAAASTAAKRELALRLGAEAAVDSSQPGWAGEVRRLSGKRGVDWVVEHVGGETLEQSLHCLARGGSVVTCGATAGRNVELNLWPLFVKQQRLIGSYGRTRKDLEAVMEWAALGRLKPVVHHVFPLSRAADAFAALRSRGALGKVLVVTS
jgi:NADPH:quinone reductase-like Zn-dependent oxidoreductase